VGDGRLQGVLKPRPAFFADQSLSLAVAACLI